MKQKPKRKKDIQSAGYIFEIALVVVIIAIIIIAVLALLGPATGTTYSNISLQLNPGG